MTEAIVVDTNVVSYLARGDTRAALYLPHLTGRLAAISFMTQAELYELAYRRDWPATRLQRLESFVRQRFQVIPASREVCQQWGRIRSERRALPIATDDAWIAAAARTYGWPLLTHNPADFADIAGLRVITQHV